MNLIDLIAGVIVGNSIARSFERRRQQPRVDRDALRRHVERWEQQERRLEKELAQIEAREARRDAASRRESQRLAAQWELEHPYEPLGPSTARPL